MFVALSGPYNNVNELRRTEQSSNCLISVTDSNLTFSAIINFYQKSTTIQRNFSHVITVSGRRPRDYGKLERAVLVHHGHGTAACPV